MFKQFFAGMEFTALPLFALGVFLSVFVLLAVRTFLVKSSGEFDAQAHLPLEEGSEVKS